MENKILNNEDFKPRKWLMGILLGIALVIVVILSYNKIDEANKAKEKIKEEEALKLKLEEEEKARISEEKNKKEFNSQFDLYGSSTLGSSIKKELSTIISSNNKYNEHLVEVIYNNISYKTDEEINNFILTINDWSEYTSSFNYDDNGYINKYNLTITLDKNIEDYNYNLSYQTYAGENWGNVVKMLFDKMAELNKNNDRKVTLVLNGKTYTTYDEIVSAKKRLGDWSDYQVTYEKDAEGYYYKIIVTSL